MWASVRDHDEARAEQFGEELGDAQVDVHSVANHFNVRGGV